MHTVKRHKNEAHKRAYNYFNVLIAATKVYFYASVSIKLPDFVLRGFAVLSYIPSFFVDMPMKHSGVPGLDALCKGTDWEYVIDRKTRAVIILSKCKY